MASYASESDVYTYGLPRGALGNPGRVVDSALASTSTVTLADHGFAAGQAVTFRITQGGALPSPLVAGTTYYALPSTDQAFQVSATPGGLPITLTTDGDQVIVQTDIPWAALGEFYSRFADGFLPAEAVPLQTPYPVTVVGIVAQLMAKRAQILSGVSSESMDDTEAAAAKQLERWAKTMPVRDIQAPRRPTNTAVFDQRLNEDRIGFGLDPFGQFRQPQ